LDAIGHVMKLSCCIIAKNEGDRIERCILSVRDVVDEIVLVDSGSEDDTVAKAAALGAKIFFRAWDGFGPQKRYAEECATNDWILNLDADEVVSEQLAREIADLMRSPDPLLPAYRFRQVMVYPDQDRPRLWAESHNYVRLYDRRCVRFKSSLVHDTVDTGDFPVGQLEAIALHYSWRSLDHARAKIDYYTDLQAKELTISKLGLVLRLPVEYPRLFLKYYVLQRHLTGGLTGMRVAHTLALVRTKRLLKFLKASKRPETGRPSGSQDKIAQQAENV
jgi:glycosyltransferase involved in cell wall biosynthesis